MESIWLSLKKKKGPKGRLNWLLAACIVFVLLAGGYTACQIRAKKAFGRNQEKKKCSDLIFFWATTTITLKSFVRSKMHVFT